MLDTKIRTYIDTPLKKVATAFVKIGFSPNIITSLGLGFAFLCFWYLYRQDYMIALAMLWLNRLCDGLDGPLAQHFAALNKPHHKDFGAYYDIVSDFILYGGFPLFFAIGGLYGAGCSRDISPMHNLNAINSYLLPSATLLFAFILAGISFLAYAVIAEKRGLKTEAQGKKGFYYMAGLMEGTETIIFLSLMCLFPAHYAIMAYIFASLCVVTLLGRTLMAYQNFKTL